MRKTLSAVFALGVPRAAFACPVCFGQNDSPLATAMNMGILLMLVVVAGVLTAFASFFIYLIRRAKMVQESPAEAGHDIRGQEGTAQC